MADLIFERAVRGRKCFNCKTRCAPGDWFINIYSYRSWPTAYCSNCVIGLLVKGAPDVLSKKAIAKHLATKI